MYLIGSVLCQAIADRDAALHVPIDTDTKLHPYTDATRILSAKPASQQESQHTGQLTKRLEVYFDSWGADFPKVEVH